MQHSEITDQIIGSFFDVYNNLGSGFLEPVYENALVICLEQKGLKVEQQIPIQVRFQDRVVGEFRADLLVDNSVIVELKAVSQIGDIHIAQTLNYLKATGIEVGLLLNFGTKPEFKRFIYNL